jgi:hypothetical protein
MPCFAEENEIKNLKEALKMLDDTIAVLVHAKDSPEKDKALENLALVRVKITEGIRIASGKEKKPADQTVETTVSGKGVKVESKMTPDGKIIVNVIEEKEDKKEQKMIPHGPLPMADKDFRDMFDSMEKLSFGADKIKLLKTALKHSYFTTDQVIKIIAAFSFGSEKVQAGGMLYPKVIDKQNFYRVYPELEFQGDRDQLMKEVEKWDKKGL